MTIESAKYFPFSIKFKKPFHNSKFTITHRYGFYLEIKATDNKFLIGEASPLPGFSEEDLVTVEKELKCFSDFASDSIKLDQASIYNWLSENKISPSVAFAIEQAVFNYDDYQTNLSIEINGLIGGGNLEQIIEQTDKLVEDGYEAIKLKFGIEAFEEELKKLDLISNKYPDLNIRIDVNGSWNFNEALSNIERLQKFNIEYIEQPFSELSKLIDLSKEISIPIAADESIKDYGTAERLLNETNLILVIKPMTIGFINTIKLIEMANANDNKLVISSLFESSVGRAANIFLASLVKIKTAHGLGTANFLEDEVYADPFKIINGRIKIMQENFPVTFSKLK